MKATQEKILINGYFGNSNFGDELILSLKLQELKKQLVEIIVISLNPVETEKIYSVKSIRKFNPFSLFLHTVKCNTLIFPGGGIFQDETSFLSLMYYVSHIILAKIFRKKVKLERISVGPIIRKFSTRLMEIGLKHCEISVRDENSLIILRALGITGEIKILPDRVYDLELPPRNPERDKFIFGLQMRSWRNVKQIIPLLQRLLNEWLLKYKNLEIQLLEFQETDRDILNLIKESLPVDSCKILRNVNNLLEAYSKLDFIIGMRFHSILIADRMNIPLFGIAYAPKCLDLLEKHRAKFIDLNDFDLNYFEKRLQTEFEETYENKFKS
ncbi:MAG: polysaccharide pyruvyl transferase family protein [bacterium]|nr:polysaccharide pyruvyl transferase family protein [bacterium]